jgi:hypothetical protein
MFYLELKKGKTFIISSTNAILTSADNSPVLIIDKPQFNRENIGTSANFFFSIFWDISSYQSSYQSIYSQSVNATPEQVNQFSQLPLPDDLSNLSDSEKIEWKLYQFLLLKPKMIYNTETKNIESVLDDQGNPVYEFQDWELKEYNNPL